jgi:hypothetical protein
VAEHVPTARAVLVAARPVRARRGEVLPEPLHGRAVLGDGARPVPVARAKRRVPQQEQALLPGPEPPLLFHFLPGPRSVSLFPVRPSLLRSGALSPRRCELLRGTSPIVDRALTESDWAEQSVPRMFS